MSESINSRRHAIQAARRLKVEELMSDYDSNVYDPAMKALVAECATKGHTPNGRWDFTVGGVAYQHCGSCGLSLYDETQ